MNNKSFTACLIIAAVSALNTEVPFDIQPITIELKNQSSVSSGDVTVDFSSIELAPKSMTINLSATSQVCQSADDSVSAQLDLNGTSLKFSDSTKTAQLTAKCSTGLTAQVEIDTEELL